MLNRLRWVYISSVPTGERVGQICHSGLPTSHVVTHVCFNPTTSWLLTFEAFSFTTSYDTEEKQLLKGRTCSLIPFLVCVLNEEVFFSENKTKTNMFWVELCLPHHMYMLESQPQNLSMWPYWGVRSLQMNLVKMRLSWGRVNLYSDIIGVYIKKGNLEIGTHRGRAWGDTKAEEYQRWPVNLQS